MVSRTDVLALVYGVGKPKFFSNLLTLAVVAMGTDRNAATSHPSRAVSSIPVASQ